MGIEKLQEQRKQDSVLDKAQFALFGELYERGYEFYSQALDLKEKDLSGKILDIGAGAALFAKEAKLEGLDVTAVDPMYGLEDGREMFRSVGKPEHTEAAKSLEEQRKRKDWLPKAVAAIGKDLPFRDEHFDTEISMFSSFFYAEDEEEMKDNMKEALRVLKPGGKLLVYPFLPLEVNEKISVMNQWDINVSSDDLTKKFFEALEDAKNSGTLDYSVKYPENPPEDSPKARYIEIVKKL